jgi:DNA (cytosine-5)-methyltransferase 1
VFLLFGARRGEKLPAYPKPLTNIAGSKEKFNGLPVGPSCADALADLPDADGFDTLFEGDAVKTDAFGELSSFATDMRCLKNDAWHFGYVRDWDPTILTSSARTRHTDISRLRCGETEPGEVEPISRFFKLSARGVSNTLRAGTDGARGAFTSPRPIHYAYDRCVTVREMARLHSFPDWFRLHVTKWHGARQIGNAVPPPLARNIAESVLHALSIEPTRPVETISLGDTFLLKLDMSQASRHFDVKAPASRRDRKSGATKRKQVDIERERLAAQAAYG